MATRRTLREIAAQLNVMEGRTLPHGYLAEIADEVEAWAEILTNGCHSCDFEDNLAGEKCETCYDWNNWKPKQPSNSAGEKR